jgi:SLOG in TRPM, prokaryote/SMODS and SLOG-associating 2TM effector domain 1/Protein of unknown function (DUF4231)
VRFENGNDALVVTDDDGADPRGLLATLELAVDDGRPVIVVCGGADELGGDALARAERVLGPAVASVAQLTGAALVDGGTAAGVMEVMGKARAEGHNALSPLVGVAPAGKVTYPGDANAAGGDRTPLQANHTHFVLADTSTWGGETELLFDVAQAIAGCSRVAMVLAGGGSVALAEAREAVRRGWPVFVFEGTGGTADQLAALLRAHRDAQPRVVDRLLPRRLRRRAPELSSIADLDLREIVRDGDVRRIEEDDPAQVARRIAWEVQDEPVLKDAWEVFATYDGLAAHMRRVFERFQGSILALGVLATLLALIHESVGGAALHWAVVAAPILASVLIAIANRRAAGKRWVLLRGGAEAIKAEIYRYRTRTGLYAQTQLPDQDPAKRPGVLADQLERITLQLVQTDVGGGAIPRYDGPLPPPMYGAGRDDDGLSAVDPDRYLRIRIGDQLAYYEGRVVRLARRRGVFQVLAIGAGGAGAILAAAGLEIWIGLTTAIAGSGIAYLAYLQVDATIVAYNQSATRLAALKREWDAHGAAERDAASFESLVSRGEAVLTTELGGWVQHMTEALRELQARQADAAREVEQQMATETPDEAEEGPGPAEEAAGAAENNEETPPKGSADGAAATGAPEEEHPPAPATEAERAEGAESQDEGQRQD